MTRGLVSADCTLTSTGTTAVVRVDLDVRRHRFLRDHLVDGRALLSTVMGVEVMACAAALVHPDRGVESVSDLRVGPPFLLPDHGAGYVDVTVTAGPILRCEVRTGSDRDNPPHFTGVFGAASTRPLPSLLPFGPRAGAAHRDTIYGLFFHGPSFRVIGSAQFSTGGMRGRLATGLPSIAAAGDRSIMAPLLIELCLQTAGLWELTALGRMAIPDGVERITRLTALDSTSPAGLTAAVTPRRKGPDRVVFDALVRDEHDTPHLAVTGYRTTPFLHPYDSDAADRLRAALLTPLVAGEQGPGLG